MGKVPKPVPAPLWLRSSCHNTGPGSHCREWPATEPARRTAEIKLLIEEDCKPQPDFIVYTEIRWLGHQRPVRVGLSL